MKTATQLKAHLRNIASEKNVNAQTLLVNYMLERLLERIAISKYRDNFILKGGILVTSLIGIEARATMDMDTTIVGYPLKQKDVSEMLQEIAELDIDDGVKISVKGLTATRSDDLYGGVRASLEACFDTIKVPLKVDITTGDKITPKAINYPYKLLFADKSIDILAYNLETVLAEKIETIVSRGVANTRMRDFYDVKILSELRKDEIDAGTLCSAVKATAANRGTLESMALAGDTLDEITRSSVMMQLWDNYTDNFPYAKNIKWLEVCEAVSNVLEILKEEPTFSLDTWEEMAKQSIQKTPGQGHVENAFLRSEKFER